MSSSRRFAREIEARWSALLERPVVLGERDWQWICDWHARGIPLDLVVEAIDGLGETLSRRRRKPRNLGALAPLVEEAWRTVREGRTPAYGETAGAAPSDAWRRCAAGLPADDALRARLESLLAELDAGTAPEACDAVLERHLAEDLDEALRDELSAEVEANMQGFRDRMKPAVWNATRERALISAARRRLGLPRLGQ